MGRSMIHISKLVVRRTRDIDTWHLDRGTPRNILDYLGGLKRMVVLWKETRRVCYAINEAITITASTRYINSRS